MIVYQYRGAISTRETLGYIIDLISNGSLKFTKPSEFNDPFDYCPSRLEEIPDNSLPHAVADHINRTMQNISSQLSGVACFTPHPDKMLMWSHYGDQHRSVCVGFDIDLFQELCPKNDQNYPLYEKMEKVKYTTDRPSRSDKTAIYKKSEEWRGEKEYRLVSNAYPGNPEGGPGVWNIPKSAIKEIIFGARIHPELESIIVNELMFYRPDIIRKKAVLHTSTFELMIEDLDKQPQIAPSSGYVLGPNGNWIPSSNT